MYAKIEPWEWKVEPSTLQQPNHVYQIWNRMLPKSQPKLHKKIISQVQDGIRPAVTDSHPI